MIMKKETWKFIVQTILAVLSAIATSLGVTSCIAWTLKLKEKGLIKKVLLSPPMMSRRYPMMMGTGGSFSRKKADSSVATRPIYVAFTL